MTKARFDELRPGDRVRTNGQGIVAIIKLIRVHRTPKGDVWRWRTDSRSGYIAGRADLTIEKVKP